MLKRLLVSGGLLLFTACQDSRVKVLIGATTIVAPGAQPISDSILVVADHNVRSVGIRKDVPIPQDSQRSDVTGKWIVPSNGQRIAPGETADLLILNREPDGITPRHSEDVARRMAAGDWR